MWKGHVSLVPRLNRSLKLCQIYMQLLSFEKQGRAKKRGTE